MLEAESKQVWAMVTEMASDLAPKILAAFIALIIGWIIIKLIVRLIHSTFDRVNFDPSVEGFLESLADIGLKIVLLVIVASMLGVQTSSLVALLGAAGLAIGLALQGSLSNFAGGVLILIFKPFRVGHYIEAQGQSGTVEKVQIFNTILKTVDNKRVILPNGNLSNDTIINFNVNKTRRIDFTFGISYGDDIPKAKKILEKLVTSDQRILASPEHTIVVGSLSASSVDIFCRVWVNTSDYWDVFFDFNEQVKVEFDKKGIRFPFPQREIHITTDQS